MGFLLATDPSALSWIGAIVLLTGECSALFYSRNLMKAFLASLIAETGYLMMGVALNSLVAETGAFMHLVIQFFMRGLVFVTAWRLVKNAGSPDTGRMNGSFQSLPLTTVLFGFGLFSVMGLSPFKGSFSRFLVLYGAIDQGRYLLAAVGTIAGGIAAVYYIKLFQQICMEKPASNKPLENRSEPKGISFVLMLVLTGVTICLSLFPEPLLHLSRRIAQLFLSSAPPGAFPEFETPWSWIVLIPYVGGFVTYLVGIKSVRWRNAAAILLASLTLFTVIAHDLNLFRGMGLPAGPEDALSKLFATLFAFSGWIIAGAYHKPAIGKFLSVLGADDLDLLFPRDP